VQLEIRHRSITRIVGSSLTVRDEFSSTYRPFVEFLDNQLRTDPGERGFVPGSPMVV
jgi:hypothetical protein